LLCQTSAILCEISQIDLLQLIEKFLNFKVTGTDEQITNDGDNQIPGDQVSNKFVVFYRISVTNKAF
jgi:hypothetical protein